MATSILVDIFTRWFDRLQVNPLPDSPDVRIIRIPVGVHIYEILPELAKIREMTMTSSMRLKGKTAPWLTLPTPTNLNAPTLEDWRVRPGKGQI